MWVTELGIEKVVINIQCLNKLEAIYVRESGREIESNPLHNSKALLPIVVTELGMLICDKRTHLLNALASIVLIELGKEIDVINQQSSNAPCPMVVTLYVLLWFVTSVGIFTQKQRK